MGVHETHCCALHGCKYCDDDCPVFNRVTRQQYACEDCQDDCPGTHHEVKTEPSLFTAIDEGFRKHDIHRSGSVEIRVGDLLIYQEYDSHNKVFTGREIRRRVSALTASGCEGLPDNITVVSLGR